MQNTFNDKRIRIHSSNSNLGFAGGNNFGYRFCKGELIVLLNNDTTVDEKWLETLVDCILEDSETGIVQSLVLTEGIPMRYYEKNGTINLLGQNIMEVFAIGEDGKGEIFQANGCSLIIRKQLADELGGLFEDEYFAYSEDTYLCFKVKFRGLKIMHTSKSVVHHKGGGTSSKDRRKSLYYYQERNRLLNFLLFFSAGFRIKYFPFLFFNLMSKSLASMVSENYYLSEVVKAYLWLIFQRRWIGEKRIELNKIKTVEEDEVMRFISGKVFNGNNFFEKTANALSLFYCRITGIRVLETDMRKK